MSTAVVLCWAAGGLHGSLSCYPPRSVADPPVSGSQVVAKAFLSSSSGFTELHTTGNNSSQISIAPPPTPTVSASCPFNLNSRDPVDSEALYSRPRSRRDNDFYQATIKKFPFVCMAISHRPDLCGGFLIPGQDDCIPYWVIHDSWMHYFLSECKFDRPVVIRSWGPDGEARTHDDLLYECSDVTGPIQSSPVRSIFYE